MSDAASPIPEPGLIVAGLTPDESTATVPTVADEGDSTPDAFQSALAQMREARSQLGENAKPLDIVVPGQGDLLVLRCKWVPFKQLAEGAKTLSKIDEPTELRVAAAADTLVATCQEFLIQVGEELRPLSQTDVPIRFGDPRLPRELGFDPVDSARAAAEAVFSNEYALIEIGNAVIEWLKDTTKRTNLAFLGK